MKNYHFVNINSESPFSAGQDTLDILLETNMDDSLVFEVVGVLGADGREYNNETIFDLEAAYNRVWAAHQPTREEAKAFTQMMGQGLYQPNTDSDTWALVGRYCFKQRSLQNLGADIFAGSCYQGMYLWEGVTRLENLKGEERYIVILEVTSI